MTGTTTGTVTDAQGRYSLEVPSAQDSLSFSFIGYQDRTIPVEGRSTIDIALQPATLEGEEVVVVGYGTQQQETVSEAVSTTNAETIEEVNPAHAAQALQGSLPGAAVMDRGGAPGAESIIWLSLGFGIVFATSILLVLVPCLYRILEDLRTVVLGA